MSAEEYIAILNAEGLPTGETSLKSEIHQKGYYHNTAHVWYYNTNAEILLAQRAATKAIYPLLWDISVAGHVDAGETIAQAAIRETREEIGLEITAQELLKVGIYKCFQSYPNGIVDNEFHHTYIAEISNTLKDLKLDPDEVEQVKYVTIPEFLNLLDNSHNNSHFVASNTNYYLDVIKAIKHNIANKNA